MTIIVNRAPEHMPYVRGNWHEGKQHWIAISEMEIDFLRAGFDINRVVKIRTKASASMAIN